MTTTFETAKVGDNVWSLQHGWGVIKSTKHDDAYEIMCNFGKTRCSYNVAGKLYADDVHQSLFWDEIKFTAPHKPEPPRIAPADGIPVIVWNTEGMECLRISTGKFDLHGKLNCYVDGSKKSTYGWINYKLITPEHLTGGVK